VEALTAKVRAYEKLSHCQYCLKAVCYNIPLAPLEVVGWWKGAETKTRSQVQVASGVGKSLEDEGLLLGREDLLEAASPGQTLLTLAPKHPPWEQKCKS